MRLVAHIATEKTATTTIQEFVYRNRQIPGEDGVCLSELTGNTDYYRALYVDDAVADILRNIAVKMYHQQKPELSNAKVGIDSMRPPPLHHEMSRGMLSTEIMAISLSRMR